MMRSDRTGNAARPASLHEVWWQGLTLNLLRHLLFASCLETRPTEDTLD